MPRDVESQQDPAPRLPAPAEATAPPRPERPQVQQVVPFRTALRAWFLVSLQTFGGPAGQIAVMQRMLVD